jgi:hypothetical protein
VIESLVSDSRLGSMTFMTDPSLALSNVSGCSVVKNGFLGVCCGNKHDAPEEGADDLSLRS